jgi:putative endonuclease
MKWYTYMVKCSDESLYTGITNNLNRRVALHNSKKGAKSLMGKLPVVLVYNEAFRTQNDALKREYEIKNWDRDQKLTLIEEFNTGR